MFLDELVGQLKSQNPKTRREAARALGELKDPLAVEPLIAALPGGGEARQDIIWALGEIRDIRAIDPLLPYLEYKDWHLRGQSAEALGKIGGGEKVVDALIKALPDPQENVHWKIAFALGEIGDKKAVDPLLAFVTPKTCPRCWHAAWALGRIGDKRATGAILSLLGHPETVVRRHSVMSLKMLRDPAAVDGLLGLLEDPDWEIRQYASEALVEIGPSAIPSIDNRKGASAPELRKKLDWIIETIREES
ncbi:MAG: HEAT repeat domain-containing protein [bacterium]|nr:HEAT repeat domain-containing protein [bacterium]